MVDVHNPKAQDRPLQIKTGTWRLLQNSSKPSFWWQSPLLFNDYVGWEDICACSCTIFVLVTYLQDFFFKSNLPVEHHFLPGVGILQDMFYFCNVSSGGAATKVIGRSQTLSVEAPCRHLQLKWIYIRLHHDHQSQDWFGGDGWIFMDFPLSIVVNCGETVRWDHRFNWKGQHHHCTELHSLWMSWARCMLSNSGVECLW